MVRNFENTCTDSNGSCSYSGDEEKEMIVYLFIVFVVCLLTYLVNR